LTLKAGMRSCSPDLRQVSVSLAGCVSTITIEGTEDENLFDLEQKLRDRLGEPSRGVIFLSNPRSLIRFPEGHTISAALPFKQASQERCFLTLVLRSRDVRRITLGFLEVADLGCLLPVSRFFNNALQDSRVWVTAVMSTKGCLRSSSKTLKMARRWMMRMLRERGKNELPSGWLKTFSTYMQGFDSARKVWKHIYQTISREQRFSLRHPASENEICNVECVLGRALPPEIRSSMMVVNGQSIVGPRRGLIHGLSLLSCDEIAEELKYNDEMREIGFLPITAQSAHQQIVCKVENGSILLKDGYQCHHRGDDLFDFLKRTFSDRPLSF